MARDIQFIKAEIAKSRLNPSGALLESENFPIMLPLTNEEQFDKAKTALEQETVHRKVNKCLFSKNVWNCRGSGTCLAQKYWAQYIKHFTPIVHPYFECTGISDNSYDSSKIHRCYLLSRLFGNYVSTQEIHQSSVFTMPQSLHILQNAFFVINFNVAKHCIKHVVLSDHSALHFPAHLK